MINKRGRERKVLPVPANTAWLVGPADDLTSLKMWAEPSNAVGPS